MTGGGNGSESPQIAKMLQLWSDTLSQVLGQISGQPRPFKLLLEEPSEFPSAVKSDLWVAASFSGALRGELCLRLPASSSISLARIFVGDTGTAPDVPTAEDQEAVLELLRQVGGLVTTAASSIAGETHLHLDRAESAPSWAASSRGWVLLNEGDKTSGVVEIHISAALAAALRIEDKVAITSTETSSVSTQSNSSAAPPKLDLLMDVELSATLRFGRRRMLLREILDLTPGAVVELDRQVSEPVDVLLDGRVLAKGEVVVVEGHYGLRVTELNSGV